GQAEGVGPVLSGAINMNTSHFSMMLRNFEFGRDVLSMLPQQVREWCQRHEIAGRVDIPELRFTPAENGQPAQFKVVTEFNGVTLAAPPREWRSRRDNEIRDQWSEVLGILQPVTASP